MVIGAVGPTRRGAMRLQSIRRRAKGLDNPDFATVPLLRWPAMVKFGILKDVLQDVCRGLSEKQVALDLHLHQHPTTGGAHLR